VCHLLAGTGKVGKDLSRWRFIHILEGIGDH
jgi:hypothetical protein